MKRTLRLLPVVLCLLAFSGHAHAAGTCALSTVISPAFPVVVNKSQTIGNVLWSGTITTTYTCVTLPTLNSSTYQVLGITASNTAATVMGNATLKVQLNGTPTWSFSGGCSQAGSAADTPGTAYGIWLNATSGASCTVVQTAPVKLMAAATTLTGIIPAPTAGNYLATGNAGYVPTYYSTGGYASLATGSQVAGMGSPSVSSTSTTGYNPATPVACTVTPSTVAVTLPTVSRTSLASAGQTSGLTPFTLRLTSCTGAGSIYTALANWSFTPGPASNLMANSASTPAANVYAQILDNSRTPVTNGGVSTISSISGAGAFSTNYYARYYANGIGGAGGVKGAATFTLSYQ